MIADRAEGREGHEDEPPCPEGPKREDAPAPSKPTPSRVTPNGVTLSIFAKPDGRAPILQLFRQGDGIMRAVLRADDIAWLREQLAAFDSTNVQQVPK